MSEIILKSYAELQAEKAEALGPFSGIKLSHIKKEVTKILSLIGRDNIFNEYTKHDISHIDVMLNSLEWIIPEETKGIMTYSDWLILTLSIYFHDLGMLVTKDEFSQREKTDFTKYKHSSLNGDYGESYKEKISKIKHSEQEQFLYQEYVRQTHAERIKYWILGESNSIYPNDLEVVNEIQNLISGLDNLFKEDLALLCESHNLSDLDDLSKYRTEQPYGSEKNSKVNLHYCALILRTADLLHITSDRTPSIELRLINPKDPVSQLEWAKQGAVKSVRPKPKEDKDGNIDRSMQMDEFEIHALFKDDHGFFGLISYLEYAKKELAQSYKLNEIANKKCDLNFSFPWKTIDDSKIQTKDFDKEQLEFVLDQTKILDLLVGHTLYNDSSVVLRELSQNAIDASRLMKYELKKNNNLNTYEPEVKIEWNKSNRILSFTDNGTGMTLEIIKNHLMKVGSSRYQDEKFKKEYPDFASISRFGIGLLTCFLIADDIDILTNSCDSDKAILIKIRKVHGKYLLKYLSKDTLKEDIKRHGTKINLHVRSDVKLNNIESDLEKWMLFPACKLIYSDGISSKKIGYSSPKEFLTEHLEKLGYKVDDKSIKVKEIKKSGVTLAFALKYIKHWKEWVFFDNRMNESNKTLPIGTCIEGIRVDFNSPGFIDNSILSVLNTYGIHSPKTNVARSHIEVTPEKAELLDTIYNTYTEHVSDEISNLVKSEFSLTWAANEAQWILDSLLAPNSYRGRHKSSIENDLLFKKAISNTQCVLIEKDGKRQLSSINKIKELGSYWTIDCASYTSADSLIREVPSSESSALSLLNTIFGESNSETQHIDHLLCNSISTSYIHEVISDVFQVDAIKLIPGQRRLDLRWSLSEVDIWEKIDIDDDKYQNNPRRLKKCYIQKEDIDISDSVTQTAIISSNSMFILKNSALSEYLLKLISETLEDTKEDKFFMSRLIAMLQGLFNRTKLDYADLDDYIESYIKRNDDLSSGRWFLSKIDKDELMKTILKTDFVNYDTTIWTRRFMF